MQNKIIFSLSIFGAGVGESIFFILEPEGDEPQVYIVDCYSKKPYNSPTQNPIINAQPQAFEWNSVEGICLTHAHEDHFLGLFPIAGNTTEAKWIWPGKIPIENLIEHYDELAKCKPAPNGKKSHNRFVAESIRDLAGWANEQLPFQAISGLKIRDDDICVTFLAPSPSTANDYAKEQFGSFKKILNEKNASMPNDFHNIPSAGIIIDIHKRIRVVLLGDMVKKSWEHILNDSILNRIIDERKADILKLPHHCSNGAIFPDLLNKFCDLNKTIAVFTPYRLSGRPPHPEALESVYKNVSELWSTRPLSQTEGVWQPAPTGDLLFDRIIKNYFTNPVKSELPPDECSVSFDVDLTGKINVNCGQFAYRIK